MIRILIIEDENAAAEKLIRLLKASEPEMEILGPLDSVVSSVKWFEKNTPPDLLFLDIQLGDGLSFEIFRKVKVECPVIFTTAYDEYAIKAFELNSIDYLLKPVREEKLSLSLKKFRKFSSVQTTDIERVLQIIESRKGNFKKRFVVNIADRIKMVDVAEVAYFYSLDKNTFLYTSDNHHFPLDFSLDHIETLVDPQLFFRVNRQYIVNFSSIDKILLLSRSRIKLEVYPAVKEGILVSTARTHEFRIWLDR